MDTPARRPDAPVVVDDPWASVATRESAPVVTAPPQPGGVVKPTMPWADDAGVAVDGATKKAGSAPPTPEQVPTAVDALVGKDRFPPGVAAKLGIYVYLLTDERTGQPFFVGRGRGDRCFRHVEAARAMRKAAKYPLNERIREAESDGRPVRVELLRYGLDATAADLVVAAVDDALGLGLGPTKANLRMPAVAVGSGLAKLANIKRSHRVVLLRVGGSGTDTSYASARRNWRIDSRCVDLESRRAPRWAMVVAGELVTAVYRIDSWDLTSVVAAGSIERYSFTGSPDADLEARYVGRSVRGYLGTGTANQITYVGCGPEWAETVD